ncbi:hypothetical protein G7Z17_g12426 [Cylindrodendrum hubeiense]|uniref:Uncharacterized protein n=1 Tax=Cylindrodendrum hubeiense TaxID=595255 RepID=A0A9P5L5I0_9HYPO|nr:hypothetical protein G7Z17_g12426 [Cylindrodendrum hubeiense]
MAFSQHNQGPAPPPLNFAPTVQNQAVGSRQPQQLGRLLHPRVAALIRQNERRPPVPASQGRQRHQHRGQRPRRQLENWSEHRNAFKVSWDDYITQHGFSDVWQMELASEKDMYGPMTARKMAKDQADHEAEAEIVEQRAFWIHNARRNSGRISERLRDGMKIINDAALKVEESWAIKSCKELKHEAFTIDDKSGQCHYLYKQVWHQDCKDQKIMGILVTRSLQSTRYYLGHHDGEFIFRYCPSLQSDQDVFMGSNASVGRGGFQFCGQVPRPQADYLERFHTVTPKVLRAFASIIGFQAKDHTSVPCSLRKICKAGAKVRYANLVYLGKSWNCTFPAGTVIPVDIQTRMLLNPIIGEFAYLIELLVHRGVAPGIKTHLGPLIRIAEAGTQLDLETLARGHFSRLATVAYEHLFSGKYPNSVLVFEDDKVEDVHAFYEHPKYHSDPFHPAARYIRVDVADALTVSRALKTPDCYSDSDDDDPEPPHEADPDASDSELSEVSSDFDGEDHDIEQSLRLLENQSPTAVQDVIFVGQNRAISPPNAERGTKRSAPDEDEGNRSRSRRS